MGETNEAKKEPGRVAHAAMQAHFEPHGYKWAELRPASQAEWADVERAVLDAYAPRLATLEAEARELHRTVSELRVDAQAQRAGRVEAEHQRDVLVGKVGREVLAALVASIPPKVADVLTGAQHIDEAQQKALDDAVTRAERAERERDREREEAMKTMTYLQCRVDEAREAREAMRVERVDMMVERNAARKERDAATAEVARLSAHLTPRPDAGLAGMAAREAVESCAPPRNCSSFAEAKPEVVERKPPFRDWTDEDRARLVPGASVMWHPSWDYGAPRKVIVKAVRLSVGGLPCIDGDGTMGGVALLDNCDPATIEPPTAEETLRQFERGKVSAIEVRERLQLPEAPATIEPPATQAAPVERPPAPDLRKGDAIRGAMGGRKWVLAGDPSWWEDGQRWIVRMQGDALVDADALDLSTRVRTWQPGEVVPHAPVKVRRDVSTSDLIQHGHDALWFCSKPLAEPWTQTGVGQ